MKATEAMIVWTPSGMTDRRNSWAGTAGQADVVPWPDQGGRGRGYMMSTGACFMAFHDFNADQRLARTLLDFQTMVVRDGIEPKVAHSALLKIDEYAEAIAPDVEGAREVEPWLVGITDDQADDLVVDLKALPAVELSTNLILKAFRSTGALWITDLLGEAMAAELDCQKPVRMNVQALAWALDVEGVLRGRGPVEQRWQSIREALRHA